MDYFFNFLKYLTEAEQKEPLKTGTSVSKERGMSSATTEKSRDAARKRAERASKPKKNQLGKTELLKQILPVKTPEGAVELIYKDSYNSKYHQIIDPNTETTLEKAQSITKEQNFVQTQASQQLFGDLNKKSAEKEKKRVKESEMDNQQGAQEQGPQQIERKFQKPKKMKIEDLLASFGKMDPVQMGSLPFDLRQQHFLNNRDPMSDKEFDHLSYETVANQFGITDLDLSFNEQITNALVTLARIKAGASDSELSFLTNIKNGTYTQFGKEAFEKAKKMLSSFGDACIQLMVTASEAGLGSPNADGRVDFACDKNRFTVNAQGEISISTNDLSQSGKASRQTIQRNLAQTAQTFAVTQQDPTFNQTIGSIQQTMAGMATGLLSDESFNQLSKDPSMAAFMQSEPVLSAVGQNMGPMMLPSGEMNPAISYKVFEKTMKKTLEKFISLQKGSKGAFTKTLMQSTLATRLRGDNLVLPEQAPTHLVTIEGLFPLSNEYFAAAAANSDISIKNNEKEFGLKKSKLNKFKVIVEQIQDQQMMAPIDPYAQMRQSIAAILTPIQPDPVQLIINSLIQDYTIDMNFSLLPGMKPKELHGVEYNKIKIHGKTLKIPVSRDQELVAASFAENYITANNLLLECLENDLVIRALYETNLISFDDAEKIVTLKYEGIQNNIDKVRVIIEKLTSSLNETPHILLECVEFIQEGKKKRKRNYKREYKLFHGKPSQIKKRAQRVKARRKMEKKGLVHKGDGKDVDHKKPLRSGGTSAKGNLRVRNRSENRSDNGKYKGQPADKPRTDK